MMPAQENRSETVYRRLPDRQVEPPPPVESLRARTRAIAPAITPLIIGSLLLLALILGLGWWSVSEMGNVSYQARDFETQYAAKQKLLQDLRLQVTQLNNEARQRHQAETRRELKPPLEVLLRQTRDNVKLFLLQLNRPPLSETEVWIKLRKDLESYIESTQDLNLYSLEGFDRFQHVVESMNAVSATLQEERNQIYERVESVRVRARRQIQIWTAFALLMGTLVTVGTVWEVQRRFREMRNSMFEARRERSFTNQLVEGMVSAIAAIDEEDKLRSTNASFLRIFPRATIGASVLEPLASEEAMKMLRAATSTRVNRAVYHGRWVAKVENEEKTFDVYSSPLARGQIVTLVDATEVAESERAMRRAESLAAVGQATTQVAHEIRNPLGSIRLGVSMLRDSVTDKDGLNTIELVERGIKHLNKLVVDVTQFSRQKALERTKVELHDALERSIDLVSERIREKKTTIVRKFESDDIVGQWDADQLRQVFVNVIANAVDASPENATVEVSTERFHVDGNPNDGQRAMTYARIGFADHGKGMDPSTRERIFEPFFTTKKRGTGLGLAIVKQIVELHGGKINVKSDPGKGAQFVIDLPL